MDFEGGDCFYCDSEDYDESDEVKQLVESESDDEVLVTGKEVTADYSGGHQKNYKILKEEEIKKLQENDISNVCHVLSVSRSVACTLLCQHKWNRTSVLESWFDENRFPETKFAVTSSPEKEDHRSYVDSSTNRKWCSNVSCNLAIEFEKSGEDESENYNITCDCGHKSCWSCGQEGGHSPLDCATAAKWVRDRKNKTEADSAAWMLSNTKPCPMCHRAIQNEGSIQVICGDPCGYEFCWRCLLPWRGHEFAECYRRHEEQRVRMKSRIDIDPLARYYERFDSNDKSQKRASAELASVKSNEEPRLRFEVWEQIVECRRMLKWSYVYGYYLSESGSGRLSLFEHLLEEAESSLERLQRCADKEMVWHTSANAGFYSHGNNESGLKLKDLIWVTKTYFENLARVRDQLKEY